MNNEPDTNPVEETDDEQLQVESSTKKVVYQPSNPNIQTLYQNFKEGDLLLAPDYQRNFVWNKQKASNLIESILLNIPLPMIYTAEIDGKEEVIDGQQRLTSIFAFIDGQFPNETKPFRLSRRLKVLSEEIGGRAFVELDKTYQREIKRRSLPIISISKESQEDVKFEMFERLNTNITPLNAQELRNCLYRGPYNDLIKQLAEYEDFQYILNQPNFKNRMRDVECVLMFCAFFHTTPDRYGKSLTQMLNLEMRRHATISDDEIAELDLQFKKSVRLVKTIFGEKAFKIFSVDPDTKLGNWSQSFNQGLYQILMYWFTPYDANQVMGYTDLIREELLNLQIHDDGFISTLTGSGTNSPSNVRKKFDIWGNTIKGILKYPAAQPRAFSYNLKKQLYAHDPTCKLCGNQIVTLDDAEVDHITCYWQGGKTVPENARLAHRICNRLRGGGS